MKKSQKSNNKAKDKPWQLETFSVKGYKPFASRQTLHLKPLTIISGPNSAGKSSLFQPLLLVKQTLDSEYDPGAFLLHGPLARFSKSEQLFHNYGSKRTAKMELAWSGPSWNVEVQYVRSSKGVSVGEMHFDHENGDNFSINPHTSHATLKKIVSQALPIPAEFASRMQYKVSTGGPFLDIDAYFDGDSSFPGITVEPRPISRLKQSVQSILHLPALRASPSRSYSRAAPKGPYRGPFDHYVASIVEMWIEDGDSRLDELNRFVNRLGMANSIGIYRTDDVTVEVMLEIAKKNRPATEVNIVDVGVGVSQALPVLVALLTAKRGQIVHVEQPEIHLHPRAIMELASIFVDVAVKQRVICVAETHSPIFIRAIQTAVAKKRIPAEQVGLHWVQTEKIGSKVSYTDLASDGSFGDWPSDLDDISLLADSEYLDATFRA